MALPAYYSISQAAKILGVSAKTLRRWDKAGKVKISRAPNGSRVFTSGDIETLRKEVSPFALQKVIPQDLPASQPEVEVSVSAPRNFKFLIAGFSVLVIALIYSNFILALNLQKDNKVLGVADFIAPISQEISPLLSPITRFFSGIGNSLRLAIGTFLLSLLPEQQIFSFSLPSGIRVEGDNIFLGSYNEGTTTVNNNFEVVGSSTLQSLSVQGPLTVSGPTNVSDLTTTTLKTTSSASVGGNLTVTGEINGTKLTSNTLSFSGKDPSIYPTTTNSAISLNANGTGAINIGNSGTGDVYIAGGSGNSGCTITNSNGSLNCSSDITSAANINGSGGTFNTLRVNIPSTTTIGVIIKAQENQSADLLQLRNSVDAILAKIDADGDLTARTLESTVSTGTAPLVVASTTVVSNLNVSQLQGYSASDLYSQPQPNLILNSDFGRRNKWMTFMPEVFSDTNGTAPAGWTAVTGTLGTVDGAGTLTAGSTGTWIARAGLSTWRDTRFSAQGKFTSDAVIGVAKVVDGNNYVSAELHGSTTDSLILRKFIAGSPTNVATIAVTSPTVNNWYWLELEAQGTTYIAKLYSSGASPVAKASAALVATVSGTVSDSFGCSGSCPGGEGYIGIKTSDGGVAGQFGGLTTGDGGVYVEGWGEESHDATHLGTAGGQAVGVDESTDAGPLEKQYALRWYIPSTSRGIRRQVELPYLKPSTQYTLTAYVKTSGKSGSDPLVQVGLQEKDSSGAVLVGNFIADSGETSWTRKTLTFTTNASTSKAVLSIAGNRTAALAVGNATGTGFVQMIQLEEGGTTTPWRNAPADDAPIVWRLRTDTFESDITNATTTYKEISPRNLAANFFLPWDAQVDMNTNGMWYSDSNNGNPTAAFFVDDTQQDANLTIAAVDYVTATVNQKLPLTLHQYAVLAAGKHRITPEFATINTGTTTVKINAGASGFKYTVGTIIVATRGKGASNSGGNDLAEEFSVTDLSIEAGDVVRTSSIQGSLGSATVEKVDKAYDQSIFGIIATKPAITFGNYDSTTGEIIDTSSYRYTFGTDRRPVALQGRVPVKVTNENGSIKRGDILTSSNTKPGYAMKATKAGRSIGIAMEDFYEEEGKIMTFVNLSFYDPDVYLADSGELVINKETPQVLSSDTELLSIPQTTYSIENINTKETIERIGAYNELFVANLKVGKLDVEEITKLNDLELRIRNLELARSTSSGSATLAASISALLNEEEASTSGVLNSLTVLGKTILGDLGITGTIQSGLLSIDGLNSSISSLGDIKFQLPGGQVTIDKDGNLVISNKITTQKIEADIFISTKASGSWILPANTASIDVISENATETAKILITPTVLTDKVLTVTQKESGKFTVSVKEVEPQDIKFDWFIIQ